MDLEARVEELGERVEKLERCLAIAVGLLTKDPQICALIEEPEKLRQFDQEIYGLIQEHMAKVRM